MFFNIKNRPISPPPPPPEEMLLVRGREYFVDLPVLLVYGSLPSWSKRIQKDGVRSPVLSIAVAKPLGSATTGTQPAISLMRLLRYLRGHTGGEGALIHTHTNKHHTQTNITHKQTSHKNTTDRRKQTTHAQNKRTAHKKQRTVVT